MASKLSRATATFIKTVLSREQKLKQELSISSRDIIPSSRYGMRQLPGIDVDTMGLGDSLSLDRRRLFRYVDYEDMDSYPDISSSLDIYSDDATQVDSTTRKTVWIESQNEKVRDDLENLFNKTLKMNENAWEIVRQLCKYGNDFEEIIVGDMGVVGLNFLPTATMHRVEGKAGDLKGFVQSYSSDVQIDNRSQDKKPSQGVQVSGRGDAIWYDDWRVAHFRLRAKNRNSLYGWAITEPARWVFKRLVQLEDAVLVYKLTRSPSRYAFYIDVSNLNRHKAQQKLNEAKQALKKRKFINPETNKPDFRYSPLSMDEDFFLGTRDGKDLTRIDVLNGPSYQQVDDVQYFLNKLYAALKVPRAYLGYDENMPSRATLSQEDVRFARTVLRVQREFRNGLSKVARVHLAARNIDPASVDFEIAMTVPSAIFELGQMEVRRARADLASQMERHVSLYYLLSGIYGFSDDEITQIMKQKEEETKKAQEMGGGGGGFESVQNSNVRPITEQELFKGRREDEKRVEDIVKRAMEEKTNELGVGLRQTQHLVREIIHALPTRAA